MMMTEGRWLREEEEGRQRRKTPHHTWTFWKSPKSKGKVGRSNGDTSALPSKKPQGCWAGSCLPGSPGPTSPLFYLLPLAPVAKKPGSVP